MFSTEHSSYFPDTRRSFASGLPAQITASLNIGLSGMPFSGSDIGETRHTVLLRASPQVAVLCVSLNAGGFEWYVDVPPTLELWARWTQAGCFSGLMHEQGRLGALGCMPCMSQLLMTQECLACIVHQRPLLCIPWNNYVKYCEYSETCFDTIGIPVPSSLYDIDLHPISYRPSSPPQIPLSSLC